VRRAVLANLSSNKYGLFREKTKLFICWITDFLHKNLKVGEQKKKQLPFAQAAFRMIDASA
jgi:hypothetical protein